MMRRGRLWSVVLVVLALALGGGFTHAMGPGLTFEQRVEAQRAIERVRYRHQQGATLPFEEAFPRSVLESKVRAYLAATADVTPEMLIAEAERVRRSSRLPERLAEISAALGDDAVLYRETFIRPLLALGDAAAVTCAPAGIWDNGILDDPSPPPARRSDHTAVWTGNEMIVWGGYGYSNTGERYDPATDTWRVISLVNAPSGRVLHTAVWTGSRMIIWGGLSSSLVSLNTGGSYDPASDTWTATSTTGAPVGRYSHIAVWSGSEMFVWGGNSNTGGRYNPATDAWQAMSTTGASGGSEGSTAVWSGSEMIVWGGGSNTGGRYNPAMNNWTATTTLNAPAARSYSTAVWTGTEMVVWGGSGSSGGLATGGRYNPATDTWNMTPSAGAPSPRRRHAAVWTGSEMIIWGGYDNNADNLQTGGRYSPASDSWNPTTTSAAPQERYGHTAVWTGSLMIVFGGSGPRDSGGRYDPDTDSWHATKRNLGARAGVWTGNEMLIWDGELGGRYSPVTDSWTPMSNVNAPLWKLSDFGATHVAVWSGSEMIVWGGLDTTGGRYNPLTDTWSAMSLSGVPAARGFTRAVWTGSEMIVWGGMDLTTLASVGTGGRYNPVTDSWSPMSTTGAPEPRVFHTAIWTGSEMIVWGGDDAYFLFDGALNTGGRYDPSTDSWTPTPMAGAPAIRVDHSAIWTGTEMIVYGGESNVMNFSVVYSDGGRFNPASGTWSPTSTAGAPQLYQHGAVWTASSMLVIGAGGGRYDPATNTWHPMASAGWPGFATDKGVALWTGAMMIVWNGTGSGGRYVPGSSQSDDDEDGVRICDGDCDDADPDVWGTPGEIPLLQLSFPGGGASELSWDPPSTIGGLSIRYDVLRAPGPAQFSGPQAECLESDDTTDRIALDSQVPLPGNIYYYLVRAENECPAGQGSLGKDSSGATRQGRSCP